MAGASVVLLLAGDVMTGRGVDQVLPHPGAADLQEQFVRDARTYVELAESQNGPIAAPVGFDWPWGEALALLDAWSPDVRLFNVETSVTRSDDFAAGKSVHYRMHPHNVAALTAARPDVCVLANNHVLDFGVHGLLETLDTLHRAGLSSVGAGRDAEEAHRTARVDLDGPSVLACSVASESSGVPPTWAAADDRPGVALVPDLSETSAARLAERVHREKRPGEVVVVSIHWGSNWGYGVPRDQVRFAHRLVDAGVDVVHGHSSHHPRPVEIYRGRLVLYGCGDLVNDYEGIGGYENYRDDLRLLYFASIEPTTGELQHLRMVPMRSRRLRLEHASPSDTAWLCATMNRTARRFGSHVELEPPGHLLLRPA